MNPARKLPEFVRNPYTWAVTAGVLVGLLLSISLSGRIQVKLARGILSHIEHRLASKQIRANPRGQKLSNILKLTTLSLWGKGNRESVPAFSRTSQSLNIARGGSLLLKGIVRYPDGHYEAAFSDQQGGKSTVVKRGDNLNDLQILEIKPDQVEVSRKGQKSVYYLFGKKTKKSGKSNTYSRKASHVTESENVNRVVLKKQEVQKALSNMASFMRQVRIVPYMEKGKPKGFQLLDIVPGSIVARVGLKNGDVVERVNGKPIHTPQEAMQLFTLLQAGKGLTLEVKRNNRNNSIAIELQ
jgi:type II secretion system protein C